MLSSLQIRNFRMLSDLHVPTLGRVNLVVGKNNSGKSTVLEALRVYAQNANPSFLDELLIGHDEGLRSVNQLEPSKPEAEQIPYQNFFTGRVFPSGDDEHIYIGDHEEANFVRIAHALYIEEQESAGDFIRLKRTPVPKSEAREDVAPALLISSSRREHPRVMPISGVILGARRNRSPSPDGEVIPVGFVPTGLLPSRSLADLWDSIALTNFDAAVKDGLRIIEPDVDGIAFVNREPSRSSRGESERAAIVKLARSAAPVPLNSMGDGMTRILQLLLALVPARGGIYLVDEFENGLHYSIQEDVWKLIFRLAISNDIQVFAATHSWDCVEAFKKVAAQIDQPAVLFRVGKSIRKSEGGKIIATAFDRNALVELAQSDLELR